jgi:hypothetical protein
MSDSIKPPQINVGDMPEADQAYLRKVYETTETRLSAIVEQHGMRPGLSTRIARARIAVLGAAAQPIYGAMAAAGTPVACAKGCGCCCTLTIDVTPDELFALNDYLESNLAPEDFAALKARAHANDARGHGLPPIDRHRLKMPCPVQDPETMACLGHPARPNPCQGYLSLDLAQCEADHHNPPQRVPKPTAGPILTNLVNDTREYVLQQAGAPKQSLELTAGLVALWREPDAEERWLAGEEVLPDARSWKPPGK